MNHKTIKLFGIDFVSKFHLAYCLLAAGITAYGFGYMAGVVLYAAGGLL